MIDKRFLATLCEQVEPSLRYPIRNHDARLSVFSATREPEICVTVCCFCHACDRHTQKIALFSILMWLFGVGY